MESQPEARVGAMVSEAVLEALDNAGIAFTMSEFDEQGAARVVFVNQRAATLAGLTIDELLRRDPLSLVVPEDLERLTQVLAQRMRGERLPARIETTILRPDGQRIPIEVGIGQLISGGRPHAVAFYTDVSERRRMQAQLLQADRMATVGTVASGVAHEINNPLTYVQLNLDALVRELPRLAEDASRLERAGKLLEEARGGILRVAAIVRDLRAFARGGPDEPILLDVRTVLGSVLNIAGDALRQRAGLVTDLAAVPLVSASEGRLGQVFLNLIVNAVQATPEGRPDLHEIRVGTGVDARGRVVIEVTDTGAGIAPEVRPLIFDPFFTTKPIGVGTGLGLFICQNIVTALGGEITVDSEVGRGSCFRVALPAH